jgi:quercetin dioxygenase-like cupin family protein
MFKLNGKLGAACGAAIFSFAMITLCPAVEPSAGKNVSDIQFVNFDGMPVCAFGSVLNGDPAKGASIILARVQSGCAIPWHWHTSGEHLMMVEGEAELQMKDGEPFMLRKGGFALMSAHHVHRFRCASKHAACLFYVYSDGPFDIHYVDSHGAEISAQEALAAH